MTNTLEKGPVYVVMSTYETEGDALVGASADEEEAVALALAEAKRVDEADESMRRSHPKWEGDVSIWLAVCRGGVVTERRDAASGFRGYQAGHGDVKKAGALIEVSVEALESAAADVRAGARTDLDRRLDQIIADHGRSVSETTFFEERTTRTVGIYADDADWDDPDLEPIGYEEVPMLIMRAERLFVQTEQPERNEK